MKLFETAKENNTDIAEAISKLLQDYFSIEISAEEIRDKSENMSLSDILELDTAITNKDKQRIEELLKSELQLEYKMPNSGQKVSDASNNPKPSKAQVPQKDTQNTDQDEENNNDNSSGSTKGTLSPNEYQDEKDIQSAKDEIEKLKKVAGIE